MQGSGAATAQMSHILGVLHQSCCKNIGTWRLLQECYPFIINPVYSHSGVSLCRVAYRFQTYVSTSVAVLIENGGAKLLFHLGKERVGAKRDFPGSRNAETAVILGLPRASRTTENRMGERYLM